QLAVHEQLQAVKARVPVGELQLGAGEGRHVAGVEGANRVDVDVVGHVGGVGAQGELPGARAGPLPGQAGAEGVGHLGLQVDVPQVGIAVAEPAHHGHRHGAPAPGIALVEVRGAGLAGETEFVAAVGVRLEAGQQGQVEVVVDLFPVSGVEGPGGLGVGIVLRYARVHSCVHAHGGGAADVVRHVPGVAVDPLLAQARQGGPAAAGAVLRLAVEGEAVPLAVVDVDV